MQATLQTTSCLLKCIFVETLPESQQNASAQESHETAISFEPQSMVGDGAVGGTPMNSHDSWNCVGSFGTHSRVNILKNTAQYRMI